MGAVTLENVSVSFFNVIKYVFSSIALGLIVDLFVHAWRIYVSDVWIRRKGFIPSFTQRNRIFRLPLAMNKDLLAVNSLTLLLMIMLVGFEISFEFASSSRDIVIENTIPYEGYSARKGRLGKDFNVSADFIRRVKVGLSDTRFNCTSYEGSKMRSRRLMVKPIVIAKKCSQSLFLCDGSYEKLHDKVFSRTFVPNNEYEHNPLQKAIRRYNVSWLKSRVTRHESSVEQPSLTIQLSMTKLKMTKNIVFYEKTLEQGTVEYWISNFSELEPDKVSGSLRCFSRVEKLKKSKERGERTNVSLFSCIFETENVYYLFPALVNSKIAFNGSHLLYPQAFDANRYGTNSTFFAILGHIEDLGERNADIVLVSLAIPTDFRDRPTLIALQKWAVLNAEAFTVDECAVQKLSVPQFTKVIRPTIKTWALALFLAHSFSLMLISFVLLSKKDTRWPDPENIPEFLMSWLRERRGADAYFQEGEHAMIAVEQQVEQPPILTVIGSSHAG